MQLSTKNGMFSIGFLTSYEIYIEISLDITYV